MNRDIPATNRQVLIVTDVAFWRSLRGSSRRIAALVKHLRSRPGLSLDVVWLGEMPPTEWRETRKRSGLALTGPGEPGRWHEAIASLPARLRRSNRGENRTRVKKSGNPDVAMEPVRTVCLADFQSDGIAAYIRQRCAETRYDAVILQYVTWAWLADVIREVSPRSAIAVDTHDVMHARQREFERLGMVHWLNVHADEEASALSRCDAVIAIQSHDSRQLEQLLPGKKVLVVPWSCCVEDGHQPRDGVGRTIGYLSSQGDANQAGLVQFLELAWPKIVSACAGQVRLLVAGPLQLPAVVAYAELIELCGAVEHLDEFYSAIDVAVNPAVVRSGLKIKSLEALAWGVPLVTTDAGIAGIESAIGNGAVVTDDWPEFARQVTALMRDGGLRKASSAAARDVVQRNFHPDVANAELVQWIDSQP